MKGKETFSDLYNMPFHHLHELYRIYLLRAIAENEKREEEDKKKKQEEAEKNRPRGFQNIHKPISPTDANNSTPPSVDMPTPSTLEAEELEDMIEDMSEGGYL